MVTGRGRLGPRGLGEAGRSLLEPQWGQGLMCPSAWEAVSLCWSAGRPWEADAWTPVPPAHLPSDLRLWGVPGVTAPGEVWEAPWGHGHSEATSCPGSETQPPPRPPNP